MAKKPRTDGLPPLPAPRPTPGVVYPPAPPSSLVALRKETLKALNAKRAPRTTPWPAKAPRPWYAIPMTDRRQLDSLMAGTLFIMPTCLCLPCQTVLAAALRGRNRNEANRARLVLAAPSQPSDLMVARGIAAPLPGNLHISRAWLLVAAPETILTPEEMARLAQGHLCQISRPILSRAANYLVARLPSPPSPGQ